MKARVKKTKKTKVVLTLSKKEAKRLRDASTEDIIWSRSPSGDLWECLYYALDDALDGER